jgi:CBS domain-containing protein
LILETPRYLARFAMDSRLTPKVAREVLFGKANTSSERMWNMKTVEKPLLSLTAADLMSPMLLTIPESMSLQGAAHLLAQAQVSGAPVVNSDGRCVGVISAHDFVALADPGARPAKQPEHAECFCKAWQIVDGDQLPECAVRNYMTADPVTALPGTLVGALAQTMVDAHIHRVIVLDRLDRPIGVVSSIDVLAAVAQAARARGSAVGDPLFAAHGVCP